ncbi:chromate transporter [Paramaledivibacter caminithermalis]|jgi:chromate transporter|uniref:Chromate transporter n=1 Tax=Paramaledivibacter caminithermalis (strain DSM 15212 / CIP 107654 / DViRD3) TaxID=1121301 RepID=A0A1M6PVR1_PARC5|nr:chromate transporter [Paramaledivibacter caminithermalis]SHK12016.1 chromate transporter [Paramaledivibacter caminithermalis DSM 15212]
MKLIINIFFAFLKIGGFSFGGGYAMIPFIEKEIVNSHGWLNGAEFIDIIAIAEMTPGPIAINSATFVGYKIAKIQGAIAGTIGVILVSFILLILTGKYLTDAKDSKVINNIFIGIRPAVLGLIVAAAISVGKTALVDFRSCIIAVIILFSILKLKIHPIICVIMAGVMGCVIY